MKEDEISNYRNHNQTFSFPTRNKNQIRSKKFITNWNETTDPKILLDPQRKTKQNQNQIYETRIRSLDVNQRERKRWWKREREREHGPGSGSAEREWTKRKEAFGERESEGKWGYGERRVQRRDWMKRRFVHL